MKNVSDIALKTFSKKTLYHISLPNFSKELSRRKNNIKGDNTMDINDDLKIFKTTLVKMSSQMAKEYLLHNNSNRKLREYYVSYFIDLIKRGEWNTTHQGIAIDQENNIIDGQHRLEAIARSGVTVEILVTTYKGHVSPMMVPIDLGLQRNFTDITGIDRKSIQIINIFYTIFLGKRKRQLTGPLCHDFYNTFKKQIIKVNESSSTGTIYDRAAIRSAVVYHLIFNKNWIENFEILQSRKTSGKFLNKELRIVDDYFENLGFHGGDGYGYASQRHNLGAMIYMIDNPCEIPDESDIDITIASSRENFKKAYPEFKD